MPYKISKKLLILNIIIGSINLIWYTFIYITTFHGWGSDNSSGHIMFWLGHVLFPILIGYELLAIFNISIAIFTIKKIKDLFHYNTKIIKNIILVLLVMVTWLNVYTFNIINISIIVYFKCKNRIVNKITIENVDQNIAVVKKYKVHRSTKMSIIDKANEYSRRHYN